MFEWGLDKKVTIAKAKAVLQKPKGRVALIDTTTPTRDMAVAGAHYIVSESKRGRGPVRYGISEKQSHQYIPQRILWHGEAAPFARREDAQHVVDILNRAAGGV